MKERKPHLLKVKQEIVGLVDVHIRNLKSGLGCTNEGDAALRRELAIWIRQRNKIARDADVEPIDLLKKDGQGKIIY